VTSQRLEEILAGFERAAVAVVGLAIVVIAHAAS